jgi:hypothetical protein
MDSVHCTEFVDSRERSHPSSHHHGRNLLTLFNIDEFVLLFVPKSVNSTSVIPFILGFCNLFSSCKRIRGAVPDFIRCIQSLLVMPETCCRIKSDWSRVEGLSLGDYLMLLRNFYTSGDLEPVLVQLTFKIPLANIPPLVSIVRPVHLDRPVNNVRLLDMESWDNPSATIRAYTGVFSRFQETGNVFEILKRGFGASRSNRWVACGVLEILKSRGLVTNPERMDMLKDLFLNSFGVNDLNPEVTGLPDDEELDILPNLLWFHVGFNLEEVSDRGLSFEVLHLLRNW